MQFWMFISAILISANCFGAPQAEMGPAPQIRTEIDVPVSVLIRNTAFQVRNYSNPNTLTKILTNVLPAVQNGEELRQILNSVESNRAIQENPITESAVYNVVLPYLVHHEEIFWESKPSVREVDMALQEGLHGAPLRQREFFLKALPYISDPENLYILDWFARHRPSVNWHIARELARRGDSPYPAVCHLALRLVRSLQTYQE